MPPIVRTATHQKKFLFILTMVCLFAISSVFLGQFILNKYNNLDAVPPITSEEKKMREYWGDQVQQYPPDVVYRSFIESYLQQDENRWHGAMHILASLLYERYGSEALQFCDESFQQACYHELMSSFAYEGKITESSKINGLCNKDWNCLHGIGHGLVMYYGYDQAELNNTLSKCPQEQSAFIEGCQSGMFMEYITRTMGSSRGETNKFFNKINWNLCSEVEPKYQGACHFVMVESIIAKNDQSKEEIIASVSEYCQVSAKGYEDACFKGAGFNAKFLTEEYTEGIALCESMTAGHKEHADSCLTALALQYSFFSKRDLAKLICEASSLENQTECLSIL